MPKSQRRTPAARAFSHLTEEERMDRACELLAMGVLRLAEKRGLLKRTTEGQASELKSDEQKALHSETHLDGKTSNDEEST